MISFKFSNEYGHIEIDCDREGMEKLIEVLEGLKTQGPTHIHLYAPSLGGDFLSDQDPWGQSAISEVIISTGGDDLVDN